MDLAGKAMRRQPLGHGVGIGECLVQALRGGANDTVQMDSTHDFTSFECAEDSPLTCRRTKTAYFDTRLRMARIPGATTACRHQRRSERSSRTPRPRRWRRSVRNVAPSA